MRLLGLMLGRYIGALICGGAWLASATPVGLLDVAQLITTSDAIAVGKIASVQRTGRGTVTISDQAIGANASQNWASHPSVINAFIFRAAGC